MKTNKILIIGAGLGGLALAQGLVKAGFDVTVYERDVSPTSRTQGYRISIRSMGMQALSSLLPQDRANRLSTAKVADVGDGFTCANEKMEPIFTVPLGQAASVQFLRSELKKLLQEDIKIEWNKHLIHFEVKDEQVIAHFEDGSSATGDLLVGCDGVGSTVRELLPSLYNDKLGSIPKVIPCNRAILGGQIDRTTEWEALLPLNKTGIVRFQGPYSHYMAVCFSERADRSPTVFWAFAEDMEDNDAWYQMDEDYHIRILDHCKKLIDDGAWHPNLQKLIHATPAEAIMPPWFISTTRFPETDHFPIVPSGRVTLLGDAAHAMPNERALGGNNVLEDARVLSELLVSEADWPKVVEKFEREMYSRAKTAVQESEGAAEYFRNMLSNK